MRRLSSGLTTFVCEVVISQADVGVALENIKIAVFPRRIETCETKTHESEVLVVFMSKGNVDVYGLIVKAYKKGHALIFVSPVFRRIHDVETVLYMKLPEVSPVLEQMTQEQREIMTVLYYVNNNSVRLDTGAAGLSSLNVLKNEELLPTLNDPYKLDDKLIRSEAYALLARVPAYVDEFLPHVTADELYETVKLATETGLLTLKQRICAKTGELMTKFRVNLTFLDIMPTLETIPIVFLRHIGCPVFVAEMKKNVNFQVYTPPRRLDVFLPTRRDLFFLKKCGTATTLDVIEAAFDSKENFMLTTHLAVSTVMAKIDHDISTMYCARFNVYLHTDVDNVAFYRKKFDFFNSWTRLSTPAKALYKMYAEAQCQEDIGPLLLLVSQLHMNVSNKLEGVVTHTFQLLCIKMFLASGITDDYTTQHIVDCLDGKNLHDIGFFDRFLVLVNPNLLINYNKDEIAQLFTTSDHRQRQRPCVDMKVGFLYLSQLIVQFLKSNVLHRFRRASIAKYIDCHSIDTTKPPPNVLKAVLNRNMLQNTTKFVATCEANGYASFFQMQQMLHERFFTFQRDVNPSCCIDTFTHIQNEVVDLMHNFTMDDIFTFLIN
ncbi:MAG: hypothetical protein MUO31_02645 [Thermodesulfovibrionales bacterium]|nr:hypothetical protein [Thermodesulfovibrionales bacterium]